jgi:hypothetical protein
MGGAASDHDETFILHKDGERAGNVDMLDAAQTGDLIDDRFEKDMTALRDS